MRGKRDLPRLRLARILALVVAAATGVLGKHFGKCPERARSEPDWRRCSRL